KDQRFLVFRNEIRRPAAVPAGPPGRLQQVPAARGLGPEVALVVVVGGEDVRHALDHRDAAAGQRRYLLWVVGEKAHPGYAELAQHLRRRQVDPLVGIETQLLVGVDRVEARVLQLIGPELVDEPDAAAF